MNPTPHWPNDASGDALRRLYAAGDELTQSRAVDFCFVFPEREGALAFVRDVDDRVFETCLLAYPGKPLWQVIVKCDIIPNHAQITAIESALTSKARAIGGKADGWGCMVIASASQSG